MNMEKSAKVLIVGNNPQISEIVAEKKTLLSHKPIRVTHGEEALKIASSQPPFDLLLTDIVTPEVNGEDFTIQFTKLSPKTKVIYMIY